MGKQNAMLNRIESSIEARYNAMFRAKLRMLLQIGQDAALLTAHNVLHLGPGRAVKLSVMRILHLGRNDMETKTSLRRTIAIDFDGCLCADAYPDIGAPNWNVIVRAAQAQNAGTGLILWTCREGQLLQDALEACKRWGLEFDAVNESLPDWIAFYGTKPRKAGATEYWDDRAVRLPQPTGTQLMPPTARCREALLQENTQLRAENIRWGQVAGEQDKQIEKLRAELEKVTLERDAAIDDITRGCRTCRKRKTCKSIALDPQRSPCSDWEWRGPVQRRNGV